MFLCHTVFSCMKSQSAQPALLRAESSHTVHAGLLLSDCSTGFKPPGLWRSTAAFCQATLMSCSSFSSTSSLPCSSMAANIAASTSIHARARSLSFVGAVADLSMLREYSCRVHHQLRALVIKFSSLRPKSLDMRCDACACMSAAIYQATRTVWLSTDALCRAALMSCSFFSSLSSLPCSCMAAVLAASASMRAKARSLSLGMA